MSGNVLFTPDNSGPGSYAIQFGGPGGDILAGTFTASSAIALSGSRTDSAYQYTGRSFIIVFADTTVNRGSASTLVPLQGTFSYNYTAVATPEPSSVLLLGSGLLAIAGATRNRVLQRT